MQQGIGTPAMALSASSRDTPSPTLEPQKGMILEYNKPSAIFSKLQCDSELQLRPSLIVD